MFKILKVLATVIFIMLAILYGIGLVIWCGMFYKFALNL